MLTKKTRNLAFLLINLEGHKALSVSEDSSYLVVCINEQNIYSHITQL